MAKRKPINFPSLVRDGGWRVVKAGPADSMSHYFKMHRGVPYRIKHNRRKLCWVLSLDGINVAEGDLDSMLLRADAIMNGV